MPQKTLTCVCFNRCHSLSESHRRTLRGDRGRIKSSEWSLTWSSLAEGGGGACSGARFEGAASPAVIDGAGSCGERDNGGKFISPTSPCEPIILSQEWTPAPARILQSWPRRVEGEREGKSKGISMFQGPDTKYLYGFPQRSRFIRGTFLTWGVSGHSHNIL